jgi:hypothetical protein
MDTCFGLGRPLKGPKVDQEVFRISNERVSSPWPFRPASAIPAEQLDILDMPIAR